MYFEKIENPNPNLKPMKKVILLMLISLVFVGCKKEDKDDPIETARCIRTKDMMKYSKDTKEMIRDGRYKTALKRCVWFHENALKYEPDMSGVRLSFALSDWKKLADHYPPALKSLKDIRDRDTKRVLQNGDALLFADVSSINRELEEDSKSISLFVTLAKKYPSMVKKYWTSVDEPLFDAKRYDIIKTYIGNPMDQYSIFKNHLDIAIDGSEEDKSLNDFLKKDFAERCAKLIDYCLAVNEPAAAKEIRKKALKVIDDAYLAGAITDFKL